MDRNTGPNAGRGKRKEGPPFKRRPFHCRTVARLREALPASRRDLSRPSQISCTEPQQRQGPSSRMPATAAIDNETLDHLLSVVDGRQQYKPVPRIRKGFRGDELSAPGATSWRRPRCPAEGGNEGKQSMQRSKTTLAVLAATFLAASAGLALAQSSGGAGGGSAGASGGTSAGATGGTSTSTGGISSSMSSPTSGGTMGTNPATTSGTVATTPSGIGTGSTTGQSGARTGLNGAPCTTSGSASASGGSPANAGVNGGATTGPGAGC